MSKAVLISIRPEWCEKIASGEKTIEVRKTRPKLDTPFKAYIYCTRRSPYLNRHNGKLYLEAKDILGGRGAGLYQRLSGCVIGEFVCDSFVTDRTFGHDALFNAAACLSEIDAAAYCLNDPMYGWHISQLRIYDTPKELREFYRPCVPTCEYRNACGGAIKCLFPIRRAPQSWCYVEELT